MRHQPVMITWEFYVCPCGNRTFELRTFATRTVAPRTSALLPEQIPPGVVNVHTQAGWHSLSLTTFNRKQKTHLLQIHVVPATNTVCTLRCFYAVITRQRSRHNFYYKTAWNINTVTELNCMAPLWRFCSFGTVYRRMSLSLSAVLVGVRT